MADAADAMSWRTVVGSTRAWSNRSNYERAVGVRHNDDAALYAFCRDHNYCKRLGGHCMSARLACTVYSADMLDGSNALFRKLDCVYRADCSYGHALARKKKIHKAMEGVLFDEYSLAPNCIVRNLILINYI